MFGVDHILFGTDIPFREDIREQLQDLEALTLTDTERRAVDGGNAARLLGIELKSQN
jgi:predicted TIM-barrel fold metal-dependent hydrolase